MVSFCGNGLNYVTYSSTLSNICNTTQLDNALNATTPSKISGENPDMGLWTGLMLIWHIMKSLTMIWHIMKSLTIASKAFHLISTNLTNVPWVNLYWISSGILNPLKIMGFVGESYFRIMHIMKSLKISETAKFISTKFHMNVPLVILH